MEMGSAGLNEHAGVAKSMHSSNDEIDNVSSTEKLNLQRPKFSPCSDCGRQFTLRALEIHKRSCTEKSDCSCSVCKTSLVSHNVHAATSANDVGFSEKGNNSCKISSGSNVMKYLQNGKLFYVIKRSPGIQSKSIAGQKTPDILRGGIQEIKLCKAVHIDGCVKQTGIRYVDHSYSNIGPKLDLSSLSNCKNISSGSKNDKADSLEKINNSVQPDVRLASKIFVLYPSSAQAGSSVKDEQPKAVFKSHDILHNSESAEKNDLFKIDEAIEKQKALNATSPNHNLLCSVCNRSIFWDTFGSHIVHHSQILDNKYLLCPKCPKKFSKPGMLLIHFHKHMSEFSFTCKECKISFQNCMDLKQHGLNDHGYIELHPFHCYICLRRFSHSQTIINHMRLHSKETPFKCNLCSRSFNQIGNLHRHLSVHRGERPHRCRVCVKSFADPATLRNHIRIHTGETPFVCKICSRAFTQVGNLKRHMARHLQGRSRTTAPDSYGAKLVDSNSENTDSHETCTPTGKDNSSTTGQEDLSNAKLKVTEKFTAVTSSDDKSVSPGELVVDESGTFDGLSDENSVCSVVSIASSIHENDICKNDVENINRSEKKSKRKRTPLSPETQEEAKRVCDERNWELYPCPVCAKVYTWQHDLNIHFRIHSGEKPYACDICHKRFAQSGAVRTHRLRHHSSSVGS